MEHFITSFGFFLTLVILLYTILLYNGFRNKWIWTVLHLLIAELCLFIGAERSAFFFELLFIVNLFFAITPLSYLLTFPLLKLARKQKLFSNISERERIALLSGDTWIEKDLFSGAPDLDKILAYKNKPLTQAEKAFLNGPLEKACEMANDFRIHEERDLPQPLWNYLKKQKFFGMIIPKRYGGLEFSAETQSLAIQKLASRSFPLAVTAMVPNSLGPAELLLKYGTERQKNKYLNKLATGKIIPCFALTEPTAGSDASSITSEGILFQDKKTKELKVRLSWRKRYITLAAISDVLGLAFQLRDPDGLLGKTEKTGITCALIPTQTKGVTLGKRHDPMGVPFYNCPTEGKNVVITLEAIIGERSGLGQGWKMLMECLAAGRGISLPGLSAGGIKLGLEVIGSYSYIRRQFGVPLYEFEGVSEKIAPIAGLAYIVEAARRYTTTSIDGGFAAPIISAIIKYHSTEMARTVVTHAMDILGGAGISRGERNLIANPYMAMPIGITVEGANILTRSFIIFGQGLFRSHPYLYKAVEAIENNDLKAFTHIFSANLFQMLSTEIRALLLFLTRGFCALRTVRQPLGSYKRKILWASSFLSVLSGFTMIIKGSSLKKSEMLNGVLGDILSWLFLLTATLARYEQEGRPSEDKNLFHYAMTFGFATIQQSIERAITNLVPVVGSLKAKFFSLNPLAAPPSDALIHAVTRDVVENEVLRMRHSKGIFIPKKTSEKINILRRAYQLSKSADVILRKIKKEFRVRKLPFKREQLAETFAQAQKEKLLTAKELQILLEAQKLSLEAIEVDSFTLSQYRARKG